MSQFKCQLQPKSFIVRKTNTRQIQMSLQSLIIIVVFCVSFEPFRFVCTFFYVPLFCFDLYPLSFCFCLQPLFLVIVLILILIALLLILFSFSLYTLFFPSISFLILFTILFFILICIWIGILCIRFLIMNILLRIFCWIDSTITVSKHLHKLLLIFKYVCCIHDTHQL